MPANAEQYTIRTDLNTNPYWDDFDENKGFYRILYKPSYAVQARELIQQQTIMQNQIDRFAQHIFREGSLVSGGHFTINTSVPYVKIKNNSPLSTPVTPSNLIGATITGASTGVKAYVFAAATGDEGSANTKTLFVQYTSSGTDTLTKKFANGENLISDDGDSVAVANNATGFGSLFSISDGVVYSKDHFIKFEKQTIVIDRYSQSPTARIGFEIQESIVTSNDDTTLLDPASGSYNYAAPGADRLKLVPILKKTALDDNTSLPDFVELFQIKDGILQSSAEATEYSLIRDELARRTKDESGDYYVNGLSVRIREHKDDGTNLGLYATGNTSLLVAGVEPGLAYIQGYDIETLVTKYVDVRKATDYQAINNQVIDARMGSFILCNELVGSWDVNSASRVWLYDTAQHRVSTNGWSTASQSGAAIGSAKIRSIELSSGIAGTPAAAYRVYLFDVKMSNSAFSSVKSLYLNNASTADLGADAILTSNTASLQDTGYDSMVYPIGTNAVRSIRDSTGAVDTSYSFMKSFPITISSGGTFTISTGAVDEVLPYSVGALTDVEKLDILISADAAATKTMSGTVSTTSGSPTITGVGTNFTRLNPGDKIAIVGVTGTFFVNVITSDTSMTVTANAGATVAGAVMTKRYNIGDIIDFTGKGADAGTDRTITINSSTGVTFDLKETLSTSIAATATLRLTKTTAREIAKLLRPSRYVKIQCSTAGTTGPYNLGLADVYQIRSIRKNGSAFTTTSDGSNVTGSFLFDDGQRDQFYDHASIKPLITLSSGDFLLVELDHFEPSFTQGLGYFDVNSYPIDDTTVSTTTIKTQNIPLFTSPTTDITYDLRNCLDFRPVKTATATSATTVGAATINPAIVQTFQAPTGGLHIPVPSSQITFDYSYYLSRKDVIAMSNMGTISVIEGTPALVPITPLAPPNTMALATLTISPYPSLSPAYASQSGRSDLGSSVLLTSFRRKTMRDINVMAEDIKNLQYYNSLNLLEKQAADLSVLDDAGLDRFKNGIFVDTFTDHSLGATFNPDYRIVVDPVEKSIRPYYDMADVSYDYLSGTGVQQSNNLITLPYSEVEFIKQPFATTTRNMDTIIYQYNGLLTLTPPTDTWVDTQQLPDTNATANQPVSLPPVQTTWNQWQTTITGYKVYNNNTGALLKSYTGANANAQATSYAQSQTVSTRIEAVGTETRSGTTSTASQSTSTESLGNKVVDVSIIPYIRPQTIKVFARDLKPNTRLYVYVDEEKMSTYLTPASSAYVASDTEGSTWTSDANGKAYGLLRFPTTGKRFTTGTKKIRVSDSITNEVDATTFAVGYFVAEGLLQQKQNNILSTYQVGYTQGDVSETGSYIGSSRVVTPTTHATTTPTNPTNFAIHGANSGGASPGPSCLGYTFYVGIAEQEEGVFITSFDIYMAGKHATLGTWFEIREVDNAGGITRNTVPYSVVVVENEDIIISNDASVPMRVYFECPIFLYNDCEYALIMHGVAINPDTYFWIGKLGQEDILSGQKFVSRKLTGTLFDTNNNRDWLPVPECDLKVTFYRANFTTNVTGNANFGNKPIEKFKMTSVSSNFDTYGETVRGQTVLTFSANTASIAVTNKLVQTATSATAQVASITSGAYRLSSNTVQRYATGTVTIKTAAGVTKGTATISSVTYPSGSLYSYDAATANSIHIQLRDTSGSFATAETIIGELSGDYGVINTKVPLKYSVIDFEPNYLTFPNTNLTFSMKGTSNTNVLDSTSFAVTPDDNNILRSEKVVLGRSNEIALLSSARSSQFGAAMITGTPFVSPVIDLNRTHAVLVHNIVNSNTVNETASSGGASQNKYISQTITLAEGQDAEDLKIYITAYRPPTTDIQVYVKIAHAEDADSFSSHSYILLEKLGNSYSSIGNNNDFIETEFGFADALMIGINGAVRYTNSAGVNFSGFKQFAVKIVLSAQDSALVPRVADLRCLALQM